jgi:glutaredoxin
MRVEMYCKRSCECCEKAFNVLAKYAYDYDLNITCTDITDDAEKMAKYGEQIPIVFFDGKLRFKGKINEVLLRRLLVNVPARAA